MSVLVSLDSLEFRWSSLILLFVEVSLFAELLAFLLIARQHQESSIQYLFEALVFIIVIILGLRGWALMNRVEYQGRIKWRNWVYLIIFANCTRHRCVLWSPTKIIVLERHTQLLNSDLLCGFAHPIFEGIASGFVPILNWYTIETRFLGASFLFFALSMLSWSKLGASNACFGQYGKLRELRFPFLLIISDDAQIGTLEKHRVGQGKHVTGVELHRPARHEG